MARLISILLCSILTLASHPLAAEEMRSISGQIVVVDRAAVPDDAVLLVDIGDAQDITVASAREASEGRQSPFDFAITAPAERELVLRVGLRGHDDVIWLSEPISIPEGSDALDLGAIRASRTPLMGFAAILSCGNTLVEIGFLPDTVRIRLNEQTITMEPQPAASGTLYVDPANPSTSIHLKDDFALLRIDGAELSQCRLIRPEADITQGVWNISAIDGKATVFPSRTDLVFYPDGRMSATVGCNRLIGGYRRHGGILSFGRLASTQMACADNIAEQERHFNAVLPMVDGYTLNPETGRLTLLSGGQPVLQARR